MKYGETSSATEHNIPKSYFYKIDIVFQRNLSIKGAFERNIYFYSYNNKIFFFLYHAVFFSRSKRYCL